MQEVEISFLLRASQKKLHVANDCTFSWITVRRVASDIDLVGLKETFLFKYSFWCEGKEN